MNWKEMIREWLKTHKPKKHKSMNININDLEPTINAKRSAKRNNNGTKD